MRIKALYIIILSVLIAGCVFSAMNSPPNASLYPTAGNFSNGQSGDALPAPGGPFAVHRFLNEPAVKQIAVVAAIILLMFMILKNNRLPK